MEFYKRRQEISQFGQVDCECNFLTSFVEGSPQGRKLLWTAELGMLLV